MKFTSENPLQDECHSILKVLEELEELERLLPKPKRVGDLKCKEFQQCCYCPLRTISCDKNDIDIEDYPLYDILDTYLGVGLDQEIYDLLKARLDKVVEEFVKEMVKYND